MGHKPEREILAAWRIILVLAVLAPAFLNSLVFTVGGLTWWLVTAVWVLFFLAMYAFYLPVRYKKMGYILCQGEIVFYNGVFYTNTHSLPLDSIQFTVIRQSPFDRLFGLGSLTVVAPGGRIAIPGLKLESAKVLSGILLEENGSEDEPEPEAE